MNRPHSLQIHFLARGCGMSFKQSVVIQKWQPLCFRPRCGAAHTPDGSSGELTTKPTFYRNVFLSVPK